MAEPVYYLAGAAEEAEHVEHVTTAHEEHPAEHGDEGGTFTPMPNLWWWTFIAFVIVTIQMSVKSQENQPSSSIN